MNDARACRAIGTGTWLILQNTSQLMALRRAYVCDPLIEHNSLKLLRSDMQTEHIVALLIAERDRLSRAIEALAGPLKRRGRPPGSGRKNAAATLDASNLSQPAAPRAPANGKRTLSASGRKAIADAAKKRWAAIKAGKAPSPFAKRAGKKAAKG
jgi:hypothetical protein